MTHQPTPGPAHLHRAAIALGANLGDRARAIDSATAAIAALPMTALEARSPVIETDPVGPPGQGPYLNAAATIRTSLAPRELLDALLAMERAHGRIRAPGERWGPRTLDLDLLLYDDRIIREPGLEIPHPRLHERAFVLIPLSSIAGDWIVPGLGLTVAQARARLPAAGG
ncbi:MAG: 2-amino-4-hydroxy-6-hydroxymethyldihydropteridine diphosphokinase [Phycisphaerales bacterium]|nr:2-amino-4-hydroxy-6-hydroxymethyldihydropteridine diphosphokinase [Phycisphaerales bacterium]